MKKATLLIVALQVAVGFACSCSEPFTAGSSGISGAGGGVHVDLGGDGTPSHTGDAGNAGELLGQDDAGTAIAEAGAAGTSACKRECNGATPVCDEATNTCVECLSKANCEAPKPACASATNTCVECTATTECKDSSKPFCDTAAQLCVGCLKQADCTSPTASACSAGTCTACAQDADCSNIAGKGVCDAGTCVQCTVAKESACSGNSCDPATKQCTGTKVGSKDLCEPCLADSECLGGNQADPDVRCVPMKFMGTARPGGFCLRRVAKTCTQPYKIPLVAVSLSSATSETYCGINQNGARCEAILDLTTNGAMCPDGQDTSCGCTRDKNGGCMGGGQGGLCKTVGVDANHCTYACGVPDECPIGETCGGVGYCH